MKTKLATIIPTLSNGGAERVVSSFSLNMPKDIEEYLLLFDACNIDYDYGGVLIDLNVKAAKTPIGKIINIIKRIKKVKKVKRLYGIDVTVSHLESANMINILSKDHGKAIVTIHNMKSKQTKGFYGKVYKTLIKLLYNKADLIIAVSHGVKNDLIRTFNLDPKKIKVVYNPFDIKSIELASMEKLDEKYEYLFKSPVIINTGRLTHQKGQWHLIRAFKRVKSKVPEAKLLILGKGELEPYLKQLAKDLEIENDVFFLGFQGNPFKYISKATVAVFPSLYEGFPMVLCEAMACNTPIIYSDCKSGPREALAPETHINKKIETIEYTEFGVLVPVCDGVHYHANDNLTNNELVLSEAIIKLLEDKELLEKYKLGSNERVKEFDVHNIIRNWSELLK